MFRTVLLTSLSVTRRSASAFHHQPVAAALQQYRCSSSSAPAVAKRTQTTTPSSSSGGTEKRAPKLYVRRHQREGLYRADRVLANRTGRPRKECHKLLTERRVFFADDEENNNGDSVNGPSAKIHMRAALTIDRREPVPLPPPLLKVYHKPKWVLSVRRDPQRRPCIDDVCADMHPIGRLDYDTTGLLLFSSSGTLTQNILHPKHGVEKEYVATVTGVVEETALRAQLSAGVTTALGVVTAKLLAATPVEVEEVPAFLQAVKDGLPAARREMKDTIQLDVLEATALSTVRLVVKEGKHRIVRRILANAGHPVVSLHRERMGKISLGDVPVGEIRELTEKETRWAEKLGKKKLKGRDLKEVPQDGEEEDGEIEEETTPAPSS